jgi:hypothetical protein
MPIKEALELVVLVLAAMGSITAAILSWAQMRAQLGRQDERISEQVALGRELNDARMRHVERFQHIESDLARVIDRLDQSAPVELSRPYRTTKGP